MLWAVAGILLVLWILGLVVFKVASVLIHLLLVVAVIVLVFRLVAAGRSRV